MKNLRDDYLSDEALEELIASVESEPMLNPPKGFKDEIIIHIRQKRKYKKNLQLFSYSMKVIAATAASVGLVLVVPDNISTEESRISSVVSEWQEEMTKNQDQNGQETKKSYDERFIYRINKHMDEYVSIVNEKLNQFVRMEVNFDEKKEE